MTRDDLNNKFLVAGRRRRGHGNSEGMSPGGRVLMGRKGLGKLAGFGVAQIVTVVTRAAGERHATKITLRYADLIRVADTHEIPIEEEQLTEGGGIWEPWDTDHPLPAALRTAGYAFGTIEHRAADHFAQIDPADFKILLNDSLVKPTPANARYAWPNPELPVDQLIETSYAVEDGRTFKYQYRLRFVEDRRALFAKDRGIRVYAHKRLAAAPSLLDADTNMHGFRMTDYLDGIVYADFIDDQPEDYIATDRMSLRWESPLLSPMHAELSKAIKEACYVRQQARDVEMEKEVKDDTFTTSAIEKAALTKREEKVALRIATAVSSLHKQGFEDEGYRTQFQEVLDGLGRGELLTTLAMLAQEENPEFDRVVAQVTRLTAEQLEGFYKYARARIDGIEALRKIVLSVDFKKKNEKNAARAAEKVPLADQPDLLRVPQFGSNGKDDVQAKSRRSCRSIRASTRHTTRTRKRKWNRAGATNVQILSSCWATRR